MDARFLPNFAVDRRWEMAPAGARAWTSPAAEDLSQHRPEDVEVRDVDDGDLPEGAHADAGPQRSCFHPRLRRVDGGVGHADHLVAELLVAVQHGTDDLRVVLATHGEPASSSAALSLGSPAPRSQLGVEPAPHVCSSPTGSWTRRRSS